MTYVEWLRVRGTLKWTAIVLGVILLLTAIVRIVLIGVAHDPMAWIVKMQHDPYTKVSESVLPDGTRRLVLDNRRDGERVVIDDEGWRGKHIVITDTSGRHQQQIQGFESGVGFNVNSHATPAGTVTVIDTNGETKFDSYVAFGCVIALIVATMLGAPFAREGDGHLEIALTKPIGRTAFAALTMAVDAAGIAAAVGIGIVFAIGMQALFEMPHISFGIVDAVALAIALLAALAWYAMLAAATASLRRSYGAIQGFAWPVALIVLALTALPQTTLLFTAIHDAAWLLSRIDPLAYAHFRAGGLTIDGHPVLQTPWLGQITALAALTAGYGVLAAFQWHRAEA
jgi:hypothetical protein